MCDTLSFDVLNDFCRYLEDARSSGDSNCHTFVNTCSYLIQFKAICRIMPKTLKKFSLRLHNDLSPKYTFSLDKMIPQLYTISLYETTNGKTLLVTGMIPPSPPPSEAQETETNQEGGEGDSGGGHIRFQVTLEEGEGEETESAGGMWRKLVGLCKKLTEKVTLWWSNSTDLHSWSLSGYPSKVEVVYCSSHVLRSLCLLLNLDSFANNCLPTLNFFYLKAIIINI